MLSKTALNEDSTPSVTKLYLNLRPKPSCSSEASDAVSMLGVTVLRHVWHRIEQVEFCVVAIGVEEWLCVCVVG
jgi:hypothetical protein